MTHLQHLLFVPTGQVRTGSDGGELGLALRHDLGGEVGRLLIVLDETPGSLDEQQKQQSEEVLSYQVSLALAAAAAD